MKFIVEEGQFTVGWRKFTVKWRQSKSHREQFTVQSWTIHSRIEKKFTAIYGGTIRRRKKGHFAVKYPVLGSVTVHPPCIREVPGSNPVRRLISADRVIPEDFKKLVVTASLLGAQHDGIEWGAFIR